MPYDPTDVPGEACDFLVIGGGSAGSVLASRLSDDPSHNVMLVEAGDDAQPGREPDVIRDARFRTFGNANYLWPDIVAERCEGAAMRLPYGQARIMGGGGAINGMHAQRGLSSDYDEWRQLGVVGWGWDDVVPFFKSVETDHDFNGQMHGKDGPFPIRRVPEKDWSGLSRAVGQALEQRGFKRIVDVNSEDGDGFGAVPLNYERQERRGPSTMFLDAKVRARPNLRILTRAKAETLLIHEGRVAGAVVDRDGERIVIRAGETIVSSGALHSPALLMRSGIGAGADLKSAGIDPIVDRAGVGANLINHPLFVMAAHLRADARQKRGVAPPCPTLLRYSSEVPGCPPTDMLLNVWERTANQLAYDPLAHQIASLMIIINKVFSVGRVKLAADGKLDVKFNLLGDIRDLDRMVASIRFTLDLMSERDVAPLVNSVFLPSYTPVALKLMQDDWGAQALSVLGAIGLSGPKFVRNRLLREAGTPLNELLANQAGLEQIVKDMTFPGGHVAGTCRMGDPTRSDTVTDSRCRVVGVDGLRVVDASIFPTLMAAGTNLPVIMAAEKAAAMIREDTRVAA